jgi:hypothetical protein
VILTSWMCFCRSSASLDDEAPFLLRQCSCNQVTSTIINDPHNHRHHHHHDHHPVNYIVNLILITIKLLVSLPNATRLDPPPPSDYSTLAIRNQP